MIVRRGATLVALAVLLAACGNNNDSTWTGASGWILGIVAFFVLLAIFGAARRHGR